MKAGHPSQHAVERAPAAASIPQRPCKGPHRRRAPGQLVKQRRDEQTRLALAQQAGGVGFFDWDMISGQSAWTPQHEAIYGIPPGHFEGTHEAWARRVHPGDRARTEAHLRTALKQRRRESEMEFRILREDGEVRWISNRGVITYNKAGRPVRMIGTAVDVTEQRAMAAQLRLEHAFNSALLSTTRTLVVVLDRAGRILHFNRACEKLTRLSSAEALGKPFKELLLIPEQRDEFQRSFRRLWQEGRPFDQVMFLRRRRAGRRTISWSHNLLRDETGRIQAVIGTGLDISKCKQLEKKLLELGDAEQQRIGRDIHDGIGQRLTALQLFHHTFTDELKQVAPELAEKFRILDEHIRETISATRELSHGLSPVPPESDGLVTALRILADKTTALSGIRCELVADPVLAVENSDTAMHLYRIAQEAINNALKHSGGSIIRVTLAERERHLELRVEDNGAGFAPHRASGKGMGLGAMKHRAEIIGALFHIRSSRHHGTQIVCRLLESL